MTFDIIFKQSNVYEPSNFIMERKEGSVRYMFFHFQTPVKITLDGNEEIANPGAVILYTPGYPQIFTPLNSRLKHDYVDFEIIEPTYLEDIHFPTNKILYPHISSQVTSIITRLKSIEEASEIGNKYEENSIFNLLLLNISRKLYRKRHAHTGESTENLKEKMEQLRLDMYESPENLTVTLLAEKVGFSSSYFNKLYRNLFKVSPSKDLDNARLQYVKNELPSTSIRDISNNLGFANIEYFYVWFKKKTGLTPKEYLQKI